MIALACALALASTPRDRVLDALRAYQKLDSFSVTIEHQDDSGLFPGHYIQQLRWRKDKHFDLKVTEKSDFVPTEGRPGGLAPDYFCDGSYVTTIRFGQPPRNDPVDPGPNTMPGWEVSGGPALSALMGTPFIDLLAKLDQGPKSKGGMTFTFLDGKATDWKGTRVHEIVLTAAFGSEKQVVNFYLAPDGGSVIGMSMDMNGKHSWMRYSNAIRNPDLPADLGKPGA